MYVAVAVLHVYWALRPRCLGKGVWGNLKRLSFSGLSCSRMAAFVRFLGPVPRSCGLWASFFRPYLLALRFYCFLAHGLLSQSARPTSLPPIVMATTTTSFASALNCVRQAVLDRPLRLVGASPRHAALGSGAGGLLPWRHSRGNECCRAIRFQ